MFMVGVDEVGRGCWAGPLLVVSALQVAALPDGLTDSKLLTRLKREALFIKLRKNCKFGEGWVSPPEIDKYGLAKALRIGGARALKNLGVNFSDEILLDGRHNYLPKVYTNTSSIVDADKRYGIVSAASIYAKVTRDEFMRKLAQKHPEFGFENHVGYGTAAHRAALETLGVLKSVHRLSFKPIMELAK